MRKTVLVIAVALISLPTALKTQTAPDENLTSAALPAFLAHYEENLGPVDRAYEDLTNENLPLRDETGQPIGRRHIDDHRRTVSALRETVRALRAGPDDLVQTTSWYFQTEALVDDLFDLSQIAYDNDREELGKRFSDLEAEMVSSEAAREEYGL